MLHENMVLAEKYEDSETKCVVLDVATGNELQVMDIELKNNPHFKDTIMYCTALQGGGHIMAYDLKNSKVIWKHFTAHGADVQPYFFQDRIIANAENDNWVELDYQGNQIDKRCRNKLEMNDGSELCIRNFTRLTHNQKEIPETFFEPYDQPDISYGKDKTALLAGNKIIIFNDKNKVIRQAVLDEILEFPKTATFEKEYKCICRLTNNTVCFFYQNLLVIYDFEKNKVLKTTDLTKWNPHRVAMDGDNLWLFQQMMASYMLLN